ncbi:MAG: phosphotransferase, partial [Methylococcaceae bacterium]
MSVCTDSRLNALQAWLTTVFSTEVESFKPASSDASFRRYFRVVHEARSWIVMDAPPDRENIPAFRQVGRLLHEAGIHVPVVHAADEAQGFLLLDDLGTVSYYDVWNTPAGLVYYQHALDALLRMQAEIRPENHPQWPRYDEA